MNEKFLKPYNPQETEDRIYKLWEKCGFFNPDNLPERHTKPFSIVLPPPNATGTLHIGGSLMTVIQDIIIRYKRMDGFKTLWLPGTDHAAIATNSKVEKILLKESGQNRYDIGREAFVEEIELLIGIRKVKLLFLTMKSYMKREMLNFTLLNTRKTFLSRFQLLAQKLNWEIQL